MGYNTEIEEGEASAYEFVDDGENFDPDVAFSYLDQKLETVLGSSQKDFEGLVSAENLGPKFGEYGSFLPTYQRAPRNWSQSKTPQRICISSKLPVEGLSQHVPASPDIKPETLNSVVHSTQDSRKPCEYVVHGESYVPFAHSSQKIHTENETAVKLGNTTDKRSLKIRIKIGSDPDSRKRTAAALYSGLGLEDTPSSSLENSPETGEDAKIPQDTEEYSPNSMLEVMTSFPISEGLLISPLSDSLLSLVRNDGLVMRTNPVPTFGSHQEHSSSLTKKPASVVGDTKSSEKKNTESMNSRGRVVELMQGDGNIFESNETSVKKKIRKSLGDGKNPQSNDSKPISLANPSCEAEGSIEVVSREPHACWATGKNDFKGNLYIADLTKEDSLESIVGQESVKSNKKKVNRLYGKFRSSADSQMHLNRTAKNKADQISASPQVNLNVCQPMERSKQIDPPKQKAQKCLIQDQSEMKLNSSGERSQDEGKRKPKGIPGGNKVAVTISSESLKDRKGGVPKNIKAAYSADQIRNKIPSLKSERAISEVQNIRHNTDTTPKEMDRKMDLGKVSGHRTKASSSGKADADKLKVRSTARAAGDQLKSGVTLEKELQRDIHGAQNGLTSDVASAATAPVLIAEDWVCCDRCEKWRLLPYGTKLEHLPDKWLCSMLDWLPGMNRCDISQEATTKALQELYQPLPTQDQNNLPTQRIGSARQSSSGGIRHLDQNHQKINSCGVSVPKKNNFFRKELPKTGNGYHVQNLDVTKSKQQDSLKSKGCLTDIGQTLKESKLVKKSHDSTGGVRIIKMKIKDCDQHGSDVKKTKIQSMQPADRYTDTDTGRLGLSSSAGLSLKEKESVAHNQDDGCFLEDPKGIRNVRLLNSSKDQPQHSSNGFDLKTRENGRILSSKRKREDLQTDQGNHTHNRNIFTKEESSERGAREHKRLKALGTELANDITDIGENERGRGKLTKVSDTGLCLIGDTEKNSRNSFDQQPKYCQRNISSKPTEEAMNAVRHSMGAESVKVPSSSKVSGSLKAKASYELVKDSSVESVSSFPLQSAKTDKHPSPEEDFVGKDHLAHCDLSVMTKRRISSGQVECNQSRTLRKQETSVDSRNFLPLDNCNGGADQVEKVGQCSGDLGDTDVFQDENRIRKEHLQKGFLTGNDSSHLTRNKNCTSDSAKDKMKVSDPIMKADHKPRIGSQKGGLPDRRKVDGLLITMLEEHPVSGSKNETLHSFTHLSSSKHTASELDASNSFKKESFSPSAADVLKEAMLLRDKANHLKSSGFGFESNETCFQAALKFMHGASIFETCNNDIGKQEMSEMQIYATAAKLFENCAREFEINHEMAAAALAYKGSEVAYMRVVYCKNSLMSKDWQELYETFQMSTKGESPSSSASDVDNSNNPVAVDKDKDKDNISKTAGLYGSENHAAISHNRPDFARLLDFTRDVSSALEASRKSQIAFAAANLNLDNAKKRECMAKVKRVIDFSFQDVKGLVCLVEQAWRAVSCLSLNGSKD